VGKWTYYSVATIETMVLASWPVGALLGFRARLLRKSTKRADDSDQLVQS